MLFIFVSFVAGFLTVITPCVLPLLPIILSGTVQNQKNKRVFEVIFALLISILIFTLILKVGTLFINVPPIFWSIFSGAIFIFVGLSFLYEKLWYKIIVFLKLSKYSSFSVKNNSKYKNYFLGFALGPVFSTCSPTYFIILAKVLPSDLLLGIFYLIVYLVGLATSLFIIAKLGDSLIIKIENNQKIMKKINIFFGFLLILLGVLIVLGLDKNLQAKLPGSQNVIEIESKLLENVKINQTNMEYKIIGNSRNFETYSGKLNTDEKNLNDILKKNKLVLFEFWTYSCINCKRVTPYLNDWYAKYKDKGFEIVSVHTPEFSYEKNIDNVRKAAEIAGIKYPIFLDNDYKIWNSYNNNYWPNRFLILPNGDIIYNHVGEGDYEYNEKLIKLILDNN